MVNVTELGVYAIIRFTDGKRDLDMAALCMCFNAQLYLFLF